jgi:Lrp/AsnC family transcriptional regulator, leucine-responsive regulatory protein
MVQRGDIDLDTTDKAILRLLQQDGRISNVALAEKVNLSPPACLRRVQRLEQAGVIDGYVMLVNQEMVGKRTNLFVEISLQSQSEESLSAFEKAVAACPNVMECYFMSGEVDYLLRVIAEDPQDYERLYRRHLSRLPGVARIKTSFALRAVSRRTSIDL